MDIKPKKEGFEVWLSLHRVSKRGFRENMEEDEGEVGKSDWRQLNLIGEK